MDEIKKSPAENGEGSSSRNLHSTSHDERGNVETVGERGGDSARRVLYPARHPDSFPWKPWAGSLQPVGNLPVGLIDTAQTLHLLDEADAKTNMFSGFMFNDMFNKTVGGITVRKSDLQKGMMGVYQAIWELMCGDLRCDMAGRRLYRRDSDLNGTAKLDSWHGFDNVLSEYGITCRHINPTVLYSFLLVNARNMPHRVRKGLKCRDRAWWADDGKISISSDRADLDEAYMVTIPASYNLDTIRQTEKWLKYVTADPHSLYNMELMWCNPLFEPFKQYSYVLYGRGDNGKGYLLGKLLDALPRLAHTVDLTNLTDRSALARDQAVVHLDSTLWAIETDADEVKGERMQVLKKISTGDPLTSRLLGQNTVTVKPRATLIVATNEDFITPGDKASRRRFMNIRVDDSHSQDDYKPMVDFFELHSCYPLLMLSADKWAESRKTGQMPYRDVSINDPRNLAPDEMELVDALADSKLTSGGRPFIDNETFNQIMHRSGRNAIRQTTEKLGLCHAKAYVSDVKAPGGRKQERGWTVANEVLFAPYRAESEKQTKQAMKDWQKRVKLMKSRIPDPPTPIVTVTTPNPNKMGFKCQFLPIDLAYNRKAAREYIKNHPGTKVTEYSFDKRCLRKWSRLQNPANDEYRKLPQGYEAYIVLPDTGYIVLDLDMPKNGAVLSGWDELNLHVGIYGTGSLPKTFAVRTPSGGIHLYYRIPAKYVGKFKNRAHLHNIPIDIRCNQSAYVLGAGSRIGEGEYKVCSMPGGGTVPYLTDALYDYLTELGYTKDSPKSMQFEKYRIRAVNDYKNGRLHSEGEPDMSAIPEGERNETLYRWTFGRLVNHPDNARKIHDELFERAAKSELPPSETETIWQSASKGAEDVLSGNQQ